MNETRPGKSRATAWIVATICLLFATTFSFSALPVTAQTAVADQSSGTPQAGGQNQQTKATDPKALAQLMQSVYQFILRNYVDEPDPAKLYEGAMKGMLDALGDPHSLFLDRDMMSDMTETMDGTYAGIGLYISRQAPDASLPPETKRYIEVISPIEDTPAWKAGFRPGDLILKIDGETSAGLTTDQASRKIRGPAGTKVTLTIRRGATAEFEISAVRAIIELPAEKHSFIFYKGKSFAYLRILDWMPQTRDRVAAALAVLSARQHEGIIIDLRSNPGGLLSSVIEVSDLFLTSGPIVSTRGRNQAENTIYSARPDSAYPAEIPMVVLIDKGSASASEIFAGAMKDSKRAILAGEKSYGKGSVQQIFPLAETGFKLTMARYYTPSGGSIDKTGILPDKALGEPALTEKDLAVYEKLYEAGVIPEFMKKNPGATRAEQDAFADSLTAGAYPLPKKLVRRMVRDEFIRTDPAPVFDLEFDSTLTSALDLILDPSFPELLSSAKTIAVLAEELKKQNSAAPGTQTASSPGSGSGSGKTVEPKVGEPQNGGGIPADGSRGQPGDR